MSKTEPQEGPGKLRYGFNMIARDLDRAFALAMLGTYEAFLLQVIRELSWAASLRKRKKGEPMPEPKACHPNLSALARKTGLNRSLLSRTLTSMVTSRLLNRLPDGTVLINKDYSSWLFVDAANGIERSRFDAVQLGYIREANGPKSTRIGESRVLSGSNTPCYSQITVNKVHCSPQVTDLLPGSNSPLLKERTRDESIESIVIKEEAHAMNSEKTQTPTSKATPEDIKNLVGIAKAVFGDRAELEGYLQQVEGWLHTFSVDWVRDAIYFTGAKAKEINRTSLAGYTFKCLKNWQDAGGQGKDRPEVLAARKKFSAPSTPKQATKFDPAARAEMDLRRAKQRQTPGDKP